MKRSGTMAHSHEMDFDEEDGGKHAKVSRIPYARDAKETSEDVEDYYAAVTEQPSRMERLAAQFRFGAWTIAGIFFICFFIAWPIGMTGAATVHSGIFNLRIGLTIPIILHVIGYTLIIGVAGELISHAMRFAAKAEDLERVVSRFTMPETHAVTNVRSVGKAVRSEISALNTYLDEALVKLASAESMIRQQVQAIDTVGNSLRDGSSEISGSVARERERLIELTEMMNAQADAFAEAIAEKAKAGEESSRAAHEKVSEAEGELESRLQHLEETAEKALAAFETLADAFQEHRTKVEESGSAFDTLSLEAAEKSASVTKAFRDNTEAIAQAQEQLQHESDRLEQLIGQQRERADRLAEAIARQTEKLGDLSEKRVMAERRLEVERTKPSDTPVAPEETKPFAQQPAPSQPPRRTAGLSLTGIAGAAEDAGKTPSADNAGGKEGSSSLPGPAASREEKQPGRTLKGPASSATREERHSTSWRDILAAAEEPPQPEPKGQSQLRLQQVTPVTPPPAAQQPAQPSDAPRNETTATRGDGDIVWIIRQMQSFMVEIETRLYGRPQATLLQRYKNGERNIFAHAILQRDDKEFARKLKAEVDRNEVFERSIFDFLANFDALLEPDEEDDDNESLIDDYLGSPLGQVYVLIGSALDYFG